MTSNTSLADATALRNKLRNNWIELLKTEPNDVTCCSKFWDKQPKFEAETAEFCLLISIMFPKYSEIAMEDLVIYGMGLEIFEDVLSDMMEMRYIFGKFIDIMNLRDPNEKDEYQNRHLEMDAKAHKLAMSIASRFVLARGLIRENWLKTNSYKYFRGLSLVLKRVREYPVKLKCPKLVLLELKYRKDSQNLPVDFFEGMKELRVLSLDVPSLPESLNLLRNLQTLRLNLVESVEDISAIGSLVNLKFLSIATLNFIDIPREMGQLGNLRLLDLKKMNLAYIPPGVLSKLLKLEELYLPLSFRMWGCKAKEVSVNYDEFSPSEEDDYDKQKINGSLSEVDDGERINASLSEIASSLSLKSLQVSVQKASVLPKNSTVFNHIQRFKILVQNNLTYQQFDEGPLNKLQLSGDARDIKESGICELMSRTEILNLTRVGNLRSVMYQLEDDDFSQMKKMIVTECDEVEYLVDTTGKRVAFSSFYKLQSLHLSMLSNLKEIWYGARPHFRWFENLRQINIRFCHKLKHVFPVSMVRGLRQLQSIEIVECNEMEGIFYRNEKDDSTFGVYYIEELHLHSLPKLIGFLVQKDNIIIDAVHNEVSHIIKEHTSSSMEVHCAFSSKLIEKRLESLKKLKIAFCDALRVIFWFNKNHDTTIRVLDSLKELELYGLRNLTHIWFQIPPETMAFRNLQLLILSRCHNLYVLSPRVAKLLVCLQKLQISRCEKMEEIVVKENGEEDIEAITNKIAFPRLKELELQYMPSLKMFYGGSSAVELPLLETLKLNQCNKMEYFSYESPITPMLERIQLNGSSYSLTGDLNATMKRRCDYTSINAPDPIRTPKLNVLGRE